ncbi:hypothetical protein BKA62DRAFT_152643 [Auriculariales sp. MPI-PUGE-AT-0066]|nr:hypothetical protein BKA62DRAFT_152643 [Auriculariales sp. MPI-PUGE-AT-0066]
MADLAAGLDSSNLVLLQTGISLAIAAARSPVYNLPIFLYGQYAHERADSSESLRTFTGILGTSILLDIYWLASTEGVHGFIKVIIVLLMLLKVPTVWATLNSLRARGDQFGPLGLRTDTVWTMPGSFPASSATGAYQSMGGDRDQESGPPPVRSHVAPPMPQASPAPAPMPAPIPRTSQPIQLPVQQGGGYQTLP